MSNPEQTAQRSSNPKDIVGLTKPAVNLVPPASVIQTSRAMQNGADKYGAYNWRENDVLATIYIGAALRHLYSWYDGEECAEDSGVPHLAHASACIAILLDAQAGGNLIDDRPLRGTASELITDLTNSIPKD